MKREFIDVLLPWVSRIVHDASSKMLTKTSSNQASNTTSNGNNKLLSLDQLSNLFECLLTLLKEADPPAGDFLPDD